MGPVSRYHIPQTDHSFLRLELFEILDRYFSRPLVSVVAGGGYGKTTLVADYLKSRELPALWFAFQTYARQYSDLVESIASGLSLQSPANKEIDILEALANRDTPLAIVLDDFHLVETSELRGFLLQLVQHAPSFVTFVIIGRQRPAFPYTKLKMQNQLAEIAETQLEFTQQELNDYFLLNGLPLQEHEAELVQMKTSGWPASLPFIVEAWKNIKPENRKWNGDLLPFSELFEELEAELFASFSPELAAFLPLSSVLHEFDEPMLAALSPNAPLGLFDERLKQRLLLRKTEAGTFAYLPLFRQYLYEKLLKTRGRQEVQQLHFKAAHAYEDNYHYYNAFAHYLAATSYRDASRIMQKMVNLYTPERFFLLLDGSLEAICPSISMALFSHFLFRAVPIATLSSYAVPLKQTLENLKQRRLSASQVYLEHRLGIILFYSGNIEEAHAFFLSSLDGSRQLGHHDLISVNLALAAQCCRFLGKLSEGLELAKMALTNMELGGAPDERMHATWILTEILLEQQELAKAHPFVEELLRLSIGYDDEGARVYPLIAIGKYYRLTGNPDTALQFANQGLAEAEKFQLEVDLGWGFLELGMIYFSKNEVVAAEDYFQRSQDCFSHNSYFSSLVGGYLRQVREPLADEISPINMASDKGSEKLSIKLLGSFQLQYDGKDITLQRKSSLRLLFYLAVHYREKIPKDVLLEELFADGSYASQNNRFYVSVSTLRKALEPDLTSARNSKYIIQSGELFFLDETACSIDLAEFHRQVAAAEGQSGDGRILALKMAAGFYQGELLAEFPYESFLEPVREATRQRFLRVLQELAQYYWKENDFKIGMQYYDQLLSHDPYVEAVYWEYLELLLKNGFHSHAQQVGLKMEKMVGDELGIPVKTKIQALFSRHHE
ncbi:BTAD domain-containing putative transcriptional regulator [Neobacillus sp. Marseille-QA0830]